MRTEKVGKYWKFPWWKKAYLNVIYWFRGLFHFLGALLNYTQSIKGNDLTIRDAWALSFSLQEARMGKTLKLIFEDEDYSS